MKWTFGLTLGVMALVSMMVAVGAEEATSYLPMAKGNKWTYESTSRATAVVDGMEMEVLNTKGTTTDEIVGTSDQVTDPKDVLLYRSVSSGKGAVQGVESSLELKMDSHLKWANDTLLVYQEKTEGLPFQEVLIAKYEKPLLVLKKTLKEGDVWEAGTMRLGKLEMPAQIKVSATEDVTVPAGTFKKCLKIVTEVTQISGSINGPDVVLEVRNGTMTKTSWYAPGVGLVKEESTWTMSLDAGGTQVSFQYIKSRALQPGYKVAS